MSLLEVRRLNVLVVEHGVPVRVCVYINHIYTYLDICICLNHDYLFPFRGWSQIEMELYYHIRWTLVRIYRALLRMYIYIHARTRIPQVNVLWEVPILR